MNIHKSHSKSDLIYLFIQFGVELDKRKNKNQIIKDINEIIVKLDPITFSDNDFKIKNIGDLCHFLKNENLEGKIDSVKKEIVMNKAKKIIHFGKCRYNLEATDYKDIDEVFSDCLYISKFGFIPSVRRACKIHNDCLFRVAHINPQLPLKVERDLDVKRKIKRVQYHNVKLTRGNFILSFD